MAGQLLVKVWKSFFHAGRIVDFYSGDFQSQNGKRHGHAMVVVSLDGRTVQWTWSDFQGIAGFCYLCAAFRQLRSQGEHTLAFLKPEATQIGEAGRLLCK